MPQAQADDLSLLLDILDTCKHIEHITVAFEQASRHMAEDPRIVQAIAAISASLRSFSVRSSSVDPLALLRHIRTPLRTLGIHCQNVVPSFWCPAALERFLPRVAQTLEKLEFRKFAVDPLLTQVGTHISPPSIAGLTQYPAVRSLSVESFEGRPLLDCLQRLFPALDGTLHLGSLDIQYREGTYGHIRAVNQHTQESGRGGSPSGAWKRLDHIVCDAPMLYVLGLHCPIRLVMIDFGWVRKHGRYVADALRENPVRRLKLTLDHGLGAFGGLFSPEIAETLTHLALCLWYSKDYGYPPDDADADAAPQLRWDNVLDTIVSTIQPLHKLTHLRVVIGASVYVSKDASCPSTPRGEYAHSFRESRFDFGGAAAALARALPSLQHVFLTTGGFLAKWDEPDPPEQGGRWKPYERWYISHGWRVARSESGTDGVQEGEQSLVELHDEVAETIIRKEELVLSDSDERALHLKYGWHASPPSLCV